MKMLEPVLFREGRLVPGMDLPGALETGATVAAHSGHFAIHERHGDGSHLLVRDLLGVHKLFFGIRDGRVESSNFLVELLCAGHSCEDVFSVPSGHYVRLHPGEERYDLVRWDQLQFGVGKGEPAGNGSLEPFASKIRAALEQTFRMLAKRFAGRPVYVALSGGLDSTTIAALAAEHFDEVRAVTFALRSLREVGPGADLYFARRVVSDLGVRHVEVLATPDEILALLDDVLVYGQDYRDFNVHCGLVNAAIGKAIGALHPTGPRPVILSGDVMNELLVDYAPVLFQGHEYFGLPRLQPALLRRFLVGGLDAGDREVGILAHFGVETVQPYAMCAKEYAALPSEMARESGFKSRLSRTVMDGRIPEYVLARPKVRAQVAVEGEPAGTLAVLANRGIDQAHLMHRFAKLLGIHPRDAAALTRAGHYRFSTTFPRTSRSAWRLRPSA